MGIVSIEASEGGYTVGLLFLTDLFYLLRLPDYHLFFSQPVMVFLKDLNSYDDQSVHDTDSEY